MTDLLSEIGLSLWAHLEIAGKQASHPFHTGILATHGPDGPQARTVVLRGADRDQRTLQFHTDARSAKVRELSQEPRLSWLFYDPTARVQIRMSGWATLHQHDQPAEAALAAVPLHSVFNYAGRRPPGTPCEVEPLPSENGPLHFCLVVTRVHSIDWLQLHQGGAKRARFLWEGHWEATWLAP